MLKNRTTSKVVQIDTELDFISDCEICKGTGKLPETHSDYIEADKANQERWGKNHLAYAFSITCSCKKKQKLAKNLGLDIAQAERNSENDLSSYLKKSVVLVGDSDELNSYLASTLWDLEGNWTKRTDADIFAAWSFSSASEWKDIRECVKTPSSIILQGGVNAGSYEQLSELLQEAFGHRIEGRNPRPIWFYCSFETWEALMETSKGHTFRKFLSRKGIEILEGERKIVQPSKSSSNTSKSKPSTQSHKKTSSSSNDNSVTLTLTYVRQTEKSVLFEGVKNKKGSNNFISKKFLNSPSLPLDSLTPGDEITVTIPSYMWNNYEKS